MILKIGDVNVAGPGFDAIETRDNSNFNVGSSNGSMSCATVEESNKRTLGLKVYAKGGCELGLDRAYELAERIQTELDFANANKGHMVYYKQLDNYSKRLELLGGKIDYSQFELQYTHKHTVSMDIELSVARSLILVPTLPSSIAGYWSDPAEDIEAILVMTTSSMFTEPIPNDIGGYSQLVEFDGANYSRVKVKGRTIAGTVYTSSDITFPRLGNGSLPIAGLIIRHVTGNPISTVINGIFKYTNNWGYTFNPNGTITFRVNAKGLFDTSLV